MHLFDTNVLVYAHDSTSKKQEKALMLRNAALKGEVKACISYQSITELYSVLTSPAKLSKPYDSGTAVELCGLYMMSKNIRKIMPTEQSYAKALKLANSAGATATKIFDCLLFATAVENGVEIIYTENTKDFEHSNSVKIVNPFLEKKE